jgi:hypothetical protein
MSTQPTMQLGRYMKTRDTLMWAGDGMSFIWSGGENEVSYYVKKI